MTTKLRACSFCGNKEVRLMGIHVFWVSCPKCGSATMAKESLEKAVALWNRWPKYTKRELEGWKKAELVDKLLEVMYD